MAARASRVENQDAIDTAIVGMLADPKEVKIHVLPSARAPLPTLTTPRHVVTHKFSLTFLHFMKGSCWYSRGTFSAF